MTVCFTGVHYPSTNYETVHGILWQSGVLDFHSPQALLNAVFVFPMDKTSAYEDSKSITTCSLCRLHLPASPTDTSTVNLGQRMVLVESVIHLKVRLSQLCPQESTIAK